MWSFWPVEVSLEPKISNFYLLIISKLNKIKCRASNESWQFKEYTENGIMSALCCSMSNTFKVLCIRCILAPSAYLGYISLHEPDLTYLLLFHARTTAALDQPVNWLLIVLQKVLLCKVQQVTLKCDWACKNRACGLFKFDYFSNFWLS